MIRKSIDMHQDAVQAKQVPSTADLLSHCSKIVRLPTERPPSDMHTQYLKLEKLEECTYQTSILLLVLIITLPSSIAFNVYPHVCASTCRFRDPRRRTSFTRKVYSGSTSPVSHAKSDA
jgi:hypothetical protein